MSKFSEIITMMDHVLSPRNGGVIEHPDLTGHSGTPGKWGFLILFLRVEEGRIGAAKYHTVGCGPTVACGSMLSELVLGRSIEECRELTAEDLIVALDGVPPHKLHCPALAIGALRDALTHWEEIETFNHETH
jgi:nitrogen fixation protein NifU and related proteins